MSTVLQTVEVVSGAAPRFAVIWLHGLGADGHDFEPIVPELDLPVTVRFVFPHAPVRRVTINQGMPMRAWYDIVSLDRSSVEDENGIRDSQQAVHALIDAEVRRGTPARRIFLAGFSQGGAVALYTALRYPERLCGVIALSTYLPLRAAAESERSAVNADLPIFMAHGSADAVIPEALAADSRRWLEAMGYTVEWHRYAMAHNVCIDEISDLGAWMAGVVDALPG
jgi:phospholipase/carboxylesterase